MDVDKMEYLLGDVPVERAVVVCSMGVARKDVVMGALSRTNILACKRRFLCALGEGWGAILLLLTALGCGLSEISNVVAQVEQEGTEEYRKQWRWFTATDAATAQTRQIVALKRVLHSLFGTVHSLDFCFPVTVKLAVPLPNGMYRPHMVHSSAITHYSELENVVVACAGLPLPENQAARQAVTMNGVTCVTGLCSGMNLLSHVHRVLPATATRDPFLVFLGAGCRVDVPWIASKMGLAQFYDAATEVSAIFGKRVVVVDDPRAPADLLAHWFGGRDYAQARLPALEVPVCGYIAPRKLSLVEAWKEAAKSNINGAERVYGLQDDHFVLWTTESP